MSSEKRKRKQFRKKRQESSDEEEEEDVGPFTPRGYRTRPVMYRKGASGKQSAIRYPTKTDRPVVLLVMDSNGRNIVNPQRVSPSSSASFELAAISIPGGKTFHACTELRHLERCRGKVAHVVLALGTNDMSEGMNVLYKFKSRVESLIRVAYYVYPEAQVSCNSILSRHDEFSAVVPEANEIIKDVTEDYRMEYLKIKVPRDPWNWSDLIHMSDEGLRIYMHEFEQNVERKLFGNKDYKPAKQTVAKRFSYSGSTNYEKYGYSTEKRRTFSDWQRFESDSTTKRTPFDSRPSSERNKRKSSDGWDGISPKVRIVGRNVSRTGDTGYSSNVHSTSLDSGVSRRDRGQSDARHKLTNRSFCSSSSVSTSGPKYKAITTPRDSGVPSVTGRTSDNRYMVSSSKIDTEANKISYHGLSGTASAPHVTSTPNDGSGASAASDTNKSATPRRRPESAFSRKESRDEDTGSRRLFQNALSSHGKSPAKASGTRDTRAIGDSRSASTSDKWDDNVGAFLRRIQRKEEAAPACHERSNSRDSSSSDSSSNSSSSSSSSTSESSSNASSKLSEKGLAKQRAPSCGSLRTEQHGGRRFTEDMPHTVTISGSHADDKTRSRKAEWGSVNKRTPPSGGEKYVTSISSKTDRIVTEPGDSPYSKWRDIKDDSFNNSILNPKDQLHSTFEESFDASNPGKSGSRTTRQLSTASPTTRNRFVIDMRFEKNNSSSYNKDSAVSRPLGQEQTRLVNYDSDDSDQQKNRFVVDMRFEKSRNEASEKSSGQARQVNDDSVKTGKNPRSDGKPHTSASGDYCKGELQRFLCPKSEKLNKTWSTGQKIQKKRRSTHGDESSDDEQATPRKRRQKEHERKKKSKNRYDSSDEEGKLGDESSDDDEITPRKRRQKEHKREKKSKKRHDSSDEDELVHREFKEKHRGDHRLFSFKVKSRNAFHRSLPHKT